jgi:hypothetical protein
MRPPREDVDERQYLPVWTKLPLQEGLLGIAHMVVGLSRLLPLLSLGPDCRRRSGGLRKGIENMIVIVSFAIDLMGAMGCARIHRGG